MLFVNGDGDERREFRRVAAERQPAYEVTSVETVAAARACLAEVRFDVVVTDYRLPDGLGNELIEEARGTPLIALTSGQDERRTSGLDDIVARGPGRRHFDVLPITIEKAAYRSRLLEVESELSAREGFDAQFLALFEHATLGAAQMSVDNGRLIRVNDGYCEITGYSRAELLAIDPVELIDPRDRPLYHQQLQRFLAGEQPLYQAELQYIRKDGTAAWVRATAGVVRDAAGHRLFTAGIFQDVSDARRRDDAIRESEDRCRAFMDRAPAVAWARDEAGQHVYLNQTYKDRFGAGLDAEPQNQSPVPAPPAHGGDSEVLRSGQPVEDLEEVIDSAGQHAWWWNLRFPFQDASGKKYVGGVGVDVTEHERAREALVAARQAAEDASRAKDQFLAVLSHELRTPLTPVVTGLALLQRDRTLSEQTQKYLEIIRRNVELESRLIDDLLDVTRIEHGKVELNQRRVELRSILDRAIEVCRPDLDARNIVFDDQVGDRRYGLSADAARLQQVFWNLLKNAIKFTPQGGRVGISCHDDGRILVVDVTDSGIGIDESVRETIFRPFAQGEPSITRRFGGLGLGLAISKTLVEMHGGSIEAISHGADAGATFRVRLPLASADASDSSGGSNERRRQRRQQQLRILLVEDHGDSAEMIVNLLTLQGHDVRTAGDTATALETARMAPFDLVLSDLGLPDRSGLDLMRELRARGCYQPSIAFSGYGQEEDLQQSFAAGFHAHLVKPIDLRRLLQTVDAVMSTGATNGAGVR